MANPNINVIFQAIVAVTNNLLSNAPQIASFDFGNPTLAGTEFSFLPGFQAANGTGTNVPLPASVIYGIFVQNIGTSPLQVIVTPNGALATTPMVIGTNGAFILFDPAEVSGSGFTALKLISVSSGAGPATVLLTY